MTVRTASSAVVNEAAILAGTTPLIACRRRRSIEAWRSGDRGLLAGPGRPRTGLDGDAVRLVAKAAVRACSASLTASASASCSLPSACGWASGTPEHLHLYH